MRVVRLPYAGLAPSDVNNTDFEYRASTDLTQHTSACMQVSTYFVYVHICLCCIIFLKCCISKHTVYYSYLVIQFHYHFSFALLLCINYLSLFQELIFTVFVSVLVSVLVDCFHQPQRNIHVGLLVRCIFLR